MKNEKEGSCFMPFAEKKIKGLPALSIVALLAGCGRAPTFSILGSFFPAWLFCILAGILMAWGAHWLFARIEIEKYIQPSILVYPCIAAFCSFILWLVIFS